MNPDDRVMVVANHAIREDKCGMATLERFISTGRMYGGYVVETWDLIFDCYEDDLGKMHETNRCNILVDETMRTMRTK